MGVSKMINKRIWAFAFHLITWSIVLTIPFFFGPREKIGTESFPLSVLAVWGILAVFYFLNHYILIPAILLQKKFFLYLLLVLLFAATLFLIPEFSYRIYGDRTLPAPSEVSNIGRLCLVVSFLLILIISSSTAVIKELFATWNKLLKLVEWKQNFHH
jgi:DMSO/TMAO reductase YedYZ heme-binding membrane subunit